MDGLPPSFLAWVDKIPSFSLGNERKSRRRCGDKFIVEFELSAVAARQANLGLSHQ